MKTVAAKVILAAVVVTALAAFLASRLFPEASPALLIGGALVAMAAIGIAAACAAMASGSLNQVLLRHRAVDGQWLWFRGDPPGLRAMRGTSVGEGREPGS